MRVITHISGFSAVFGVFGPLSGSRPIPRGLFYINPSPGGGGARNGVSRPVPGSRRDLEARVPETSGTGSWIPEGIPSGLPGGVSGTGEPGSGIWGPPESRSPGQPQRPRRRGGFYINPSRRGPVPVPGDRSRAGALRSRETNFPTPAGPRGKAFSRHPRRDGNRPPPRGVDVKGDPAGPQIPEKGPFRARILKTAEKSEFD